MNTQEQKFFAAASTPVVASQPAPAKKALKYLLVLVLALLACGGSYYCNAEWFDETFKAISAAMKGPSDVSENSLNLAQKPEELVEEVQEPLALATPKVENKGARREVEEDPKMQAGELAALKAEERKRKSTLSKIKSFTGFIHAEGQTNYDRALAEMNTAQLNYEGILRSSVNYVHGRRDDVGAQARSNSLDRAQQAIDLALVHGLEAYDYLITKKTLQLNAILDLTDLTSAESKQINQQLQEGHWLTQAGAAIRWLGGSTPTGVKCWRAPSITVTKKGLWVHDRWNDLPKLR